MHRRVVVSTTLGTLLTLGLIASPAQAGTVARSNSGRAVHIIKSGSALKASPNSVAMFKQFSTPVAKYTTHTCVIDFSGLPDFTQVTSVSGCGVTVTFSVPMEKRSVPGSWGTWGSPPDTEGATPAVLYTQGATDVTLTYSNSNRLVGVEAEPNLFQVESFTATFRNRAGATVGTINRDADGNAGAKLFAGQTSQKVKSLEITDLAGDDFAIAQIRVT